jgi:hypothetical protein
MVNDTLVTRHLWARHVRGRRKEDLMLTGLGINLGEIVGYNSAAIYSDSIDCWKNVAEQKLRMLSKTTLLVRS